MWNRSWGIEGLREDRSVPFRISGGIEVRNCKEAQRESVEKFGAVGGGFSIGFGAEFEKILGQICRLEIMPAHCFVWVGAISNRGSAY
jgi:hypothetical protein